VFQLWSENGHHPAPVVRSEHIRTFNRLVRLKCIFVKPWKKQNTSFTNVEYDKEGPKVFLSSVRFTVRGTLQ